MPVVVAQFLPATVFAQNVETLSCQCNARFLFLTDAQNECLKTGTMSSCGIQEGALTQMQLEEPITQTNLKNGDNFGPWIGQAALMMAGDVSIPGNFLAYPDGSVVLSKKEKGGDTAESFWLLSKQDTDNLYKNAILVGPDEQATNLHGWKINYAEQPICVPTSQQGLIYKYEVFSGKYTFFKVGCNDLVNVDIKEADSKEDVPLTESESIRSLAKGELNRIGTTDVKIFLGNAVKVLMGIMGSVALAMFVYAGFLWMVSGTMDSVEKARSILVWSSLGMMVVFASYALVQLIFATF